MKTFESLFAELADRAEHRPAGSGTVAALDAGVHAQGKKVLEEAGEVWLAAEHEDDDALALEISQLLYRVQVLMIGRGLTPAAGLRASVAVPLPARCRCPARHRSRPAPAASARPLRGEVPPC